MGRLSISTVCCRYGHGQRSGQVRHGETTRPTRAHCRQEQETERKDRGAAHYLRESGSVSLHHAAISLGAGLVQALCRPCTVHTLASPCSSSTILSLPSGHLWHHLPVLSGGPTRRTPTLYTPMQCCSL